MRFQKYILFPITLSIYLALYTESVRADHASITWNSPVQYSQALRNGFMPGGTINFSGRISTTGCGNVIRVASVTAYLKDRSGNWQNLGTWSQWHIRGSSSDYSINGTIPSTGQHAGLADVKVEYSFYSGSHREERPGHVFIGLCPLHRPRGNTILSANCLVDGTIDLYNANLTIQNATMQISSNSTFIFRQGYSITIGSNGYIVKSASGTIIRKDPPYNYEYQSQYDYQSEGGEDEAFESVT